MTKYFCDICGKEVECETDSRRPIQITITQTKFTHATLTSRERPLVMCDECYDKFNMALHNKFVNYILEGEKKNEV